MTSGLNVPQPAQSESASITSLTRFRPREARAVVVWCGVLVMGLLSGAATAKGQTLTGYCALIYSAVADEEAWSAYQIAPTGDSGSAALSARYAHLYNAYGYYYGATGYYYYAHLASLATLDASSRHFYATLTGYSQYAAVYAYYGSFLSYDAFLGL